MTTPADQNKPDLFNEEIQMLREAIRKVFDLAACSEDLGKVSQALQAISQGAARLARLVKTENDLSTRKGSFETAFEEALEQVRKDLRIDDNE